MPVALTTRIGPSLYGTEDRLPIGIAWRVIALLSLIGWGIVGAVVYGLLW